MSGGGAQDKKPATEEGNALGTGPIVAIVLAAAAFVGLVLFVGTRRRRNRKQAREVNSKQRHTARESASTAVQVNV